MNPLLFIFSLALVVAQFALPRRWAFLPLLIAACHTPYGAALGGQFSAVRLVLIAGVARAALSGRLTWSRTQPPDVAFVVWSVLAILSAFGHYDGNPFLFRAGLVLNVFGSYLYFRAYVQDVEDFTRLTRALAVIILPLAVLLAAEALTGVNGYSSLGTRYAAAFVREAKFRAMGPFGTPILAGTAGAVCFPLFVPLWRTDRKSAKLGMGASLAIIVASASSGPIGTLMLGGAAICLWKWRTSLTKIKIGVVVLFFVVQLFRDRSAWYLLSLVDFVGGSTGWYRARLLESATAHLSEWWLCGTDFTRHWMPTGLAANPTQCDLTSYYAYLGVIGGLPLVLALVFILWRCFRLLGSRMRELRATASPEEFRLWCVGGALFAHTVTFFTISYFDQLYVFFYALVAAVPTLVRSSAPAPAKASAASAVPKILTVTHCNAAIIRPARLHQ